MDGKQRTRKIAIITGFVLALASLIARKAAKNIEAKR